MRIPVGIIAILLLSSCGNNGTDSESPTVPPPETKYEFSWNATADSSTNLGLIQNYWNSQEHYFNYGNQKDDEFQYWPQAHALDVLVDAYKRTDDEIYLEYIDKWYSGVRAQNGGEFINDFYDDMEWNALAMLRAHQLTGEVKFKNTVLRLWNDIKHGWTDVGGGGIMWTKTNPQGKNAISNAPASILASRLYKMTDDQGYLNWAKKIYGWQKDMLIDRGNGAVWDHLNIQSDGSIEINKDTDWVFTYNQGVYLGAALELYQITGEQVYLNDAIRAADYTLNSLTNTSDNVLKDEGGGDGGLFKGIFVRYFTQLMLEDDLPEATRDKYIQFLEHNADILWSEGTDRSSVLFDSYWKNKPGSSEQIDLTVQLSGCMLMEAAALLESKNILE